MRVWRAPPNIEAATSIQLGQVQHDETALLSARRRTSKAARQVQTFRRGSGRELGAGKALTFARVALRRLRLCERSISFLQCIDANRSSFQARRPFSRSALERCCRMVLTGALRA